MKAIMISIKPKECVNVLNLIQTILVLKSQPKNDLPIDVYIHCTKDKYQDLCYFEGFGYRQTMVNHEHKLPILNGKVVAKFTLNRVEKIVQGMTQGETMWDWNEGLRTTTINQFELLKQSCLSKDELYDYLDYSTKKEFYGYAWRIDNLVIFDRPKEISEFWTENKAKSCSKSGCPYYATNKCPSAGECHIHFRLTRAPQSWCYVEVEECQ